MGRYNHPRSRAARHRPSAQRTLRAAEAIRSLFVMIVLTPSGDGEMTIDVYGAIAGILHVATNGATASPNRRRSVVPR